MTTCDNCGYEWDYGGDLAQTTCPNCGGKTSTDESSAFVQSMLELARELRKMSDGIGDGTEAGAYREAARRIESRIPDEVTSNE